MVCFHEVLILKWLTTVSTLYLSGAFRIRALFLKNDLATGMFFTIFGAAQMFGRGCQVGPHQIIRDRLGVPCVNFSMPGAGPEHFLNEDFCGSRMPEERWLFKSFRDVALAVMNIPVLSGLIYQGEKINDEDAVRDGHDQPMMLSTAGWQVAA